MATVRDVAEVLIKIDDKEAKKKMPELEKKAEALKNKFEECFKNKDQEGLKEAEKGLRKVYREMDALQKRTLDLDSAMKNLSTATPKELKRIMEQLNRELNSGAIERGTKEWDDYCDKLKQVKAELKKIADEQKVVTDSGLSFKDMLDIGGDISMIATSVLDLKDSIADFMRDNVNSYISLDAEMANVQKFTGLAREGVEELNEEFKKIDTRTSIVELNKLAEEAGRLGKTSQEDILGFVKAADIINVALDDLGEGATLEISKLTNIFGDEKALGTEKSMLAVGSVINELSQNCTAAAPYLANFAQRLAGVGAQAKMTIPQIMGFAAVLDSQGQAVEMSATAVSQLITKMFQDPAKIAKAVGLDIQEFTNLVKTDTNAALLTLLERLNSFGSMDVLAPLFKEMGTDGARASAVLASLAGNIDMVREQQEIATQAYNEATSVVKEFTVQNETEEANLEKKRKKLEELKVELGEKLLPIMSAFVSTTTLLIKGLLALIGFVKEHHKLIITVAASLAAYTITVKAHTIATKATTVATKAWNLVTKAGTAVQGAFKIVTLASAAATATLGRNLKRAAAAKRALNLAMKASPVGLLVGGITAAATALISYGKANEEAAEEERNLAKEREDRLKEYTDIAAEAAEEAKKEIDRLDELYRITQDQAESEERRVAAVEQLKTLYPEYFGQIDKEIILAGEAKTKYDELTLAIKKTARARAAESRLEELEKKRIELELQKMPYQDELDSLKGAIALEKMKMDIYKEEEQRVANLKTHSDTSADIAKQNFYQYNELPSQKNTIRGQELNNLILAIDAQIKELDEAEDMLNRALNRGKGADGGNGNSNAGGGGNIGGVDPEVWRKREDAINRTAYATGQIDYEKFLEKKHNIQINYYNKMLQNVLLEEDKRLDILAEKAEEEQKWAEHLNEVKEKKNAEELKQELAAVDREYDEVKARETVWCYDIINENYGNEKILHEKLFQANVEYLRKKEQLYRSKGHNEEADKILLEKEKLVNEEKLRKQKEFFDLYKKLQKEYLNASNEDKKEAELTTLEALYKEGVIKETEYQELLQSIQDKYSNKKEAERFKNGYITISEDKLQDELQLLEKYYKEGLFKEEEYQQLRKAIQEKYTQGKKFSDGGYGDMLTNMYTSLDELISGTTDKTVSSMQKIGAVAQSTWAIAGAALEQYSAYSQACCDVEVAEIEAKYEKEIKAAGKNQKRVAQLEEQKEKDIAKVKSKYNKQAMTIEIAQAVAQTAMAAINAYASAAAVPMVGYIIAPIASAMAVAAGAMQIATIKKQHQAQQKGYFGGGFTRRSLNDREEVGVVHANEFVANAGAVKNPYLSPFFSLVDYAQRNNSVGSLTAEDVSHALGMGAVVKATSRTANESVQNSGELLAVAGSISSNSKVVQRLNERLEEGIEAYMVMDGERGFDKKYNQFKKLQNNPKRV